MTVHNPFGADLMLHVAIGTPGAQEIFDALIDAAPASFIGQE